MRSVAQKQCVSHDTISAMNVAIIGGGPAGSHLASILSKGGADVTLFHKEKWKEKPCGGGITYRLANEYPPLMEIEGEANRIQKAAIYSPSDLKTELFLHDPLLIFSRAFFDSFILQKAKEDGAKFIEDKVIGISHSKDGWSVQTRNSSYDAFNWLIGADGASGISRKKLSKPFHESDLIQTLGYFIKEATDDCIRLKFFEDLEGYAWSFPRKNNINIGIGSPLGRKTPKQLLEKIGFFIKEYHPQHENKKMEFFSTLIPSINPGNSDHLRNISGSDWALIGDAGGITDPITGEGIYYAIKTASFLGESLVQNRIQDYPSAIRRSFGSDISWAYENKHRFFNKEFIDAAVEACQKSEEIASVVSELFCGTLPYSHFYGRLFNLALKVDFSILGKLVSHLR